jgi:O-antigen ligase
VLLIWLTFMPMIVRMLPPSMPRFPGAPEPIITVTKPGDRGVILVMLAAFVVSGLYSQVAGRRRISAPFFWSCWLASALMVAASTRAGMLAMWMGILLLMFLRPSREWLHPVVIGAAAISLLLIWNPTIDTGGYRALTPQQLTANVTSIFSNNTADIGGVQGTKQWRLMWWADIFQDTVWGPDFWTGKGFGVNLADEYGYQTERDNLLRSPHNAHVTALARMGVPGLVLWVVLQLAFANQIIHAYRASRERGDAFWAGVFVWLLPIWLAALVKASFDVYLEGPQGAIPFWCVVGVGLAALRLQRASRQAQGDHALPVTDVRPMWTGSS